MMYVAHLRDMVGEAWALYTAVDQNLFEAINKIQPVSVSVLSSNLQFSEPALSSLIQALEVSGYLSKLNDKYSLTSFSQQYLLRDSPDYAGDIVYIFHAYSTLKDYNLTLNGNNIEISGLMSPVTKATRRYSKPAIDTLVNAYPYLKNGHLSVLDIGCGRADHLIEFARINPHLKGKGIDKYVIEPAIENVKSSGLENRVELLKCDFQEYQFQEPYDIVMFNGIFHFIPNQMALEFGKKSHNILNSTGKICIFELFKEDGKSEKCPYFFDMLMKTISKDGKCYTKKELCSLIYESGFENVRVLPVSGDTKNVAYFIGEK